MRIQSATELAEKVARDPQLQAQIKADPVTTIANLATPLQTDRWIYRVVVISLGLVVVIGIIGTIVLASTASEVPDALISLGSAAVGALAGLLAPSPRQ